MPGAVGRRTRPGIGTLYITALSTATAIAAATGAWRGGEQSWLASVPVALLAGDARSPGTTGDATVELLGNLAEALPFGTRDHRLKTESDVYRDTRKLLPRRFHTYEAKRFVVLSDAAPGWSRKQVQLLDRTYHQFNRFTKRLGLKPRPLRHKLVCVLFQEHDDYRRFAGKRDGVTAEWISGYYSPKHDRIVFYNIETNPELVEALRASNSAPRLTDSIAGYARPARSGLRNEYRKAATATVVHEAVHQLAFHTRIQSPHIQNPLWLSEGLATAFETDHPDQSFGPDRPYHLRETQFQEILEQDKLVPLRDLVTYSRMPDNTDDTISAVYHESYALITWMSRFRREELRELMDALRNEPPGRPTPQRQLQIFEQAFGDVDRLERLWLRYESRED